MLCTPLAVFAAGSMCLLLAGCGGGGGSAAPKSLSHDEALADPCRLLDPDEVEAAAGVAIDRTQRGVNAFGETTCVYWRGRLDAVTPALAPGDGFARRRAAADEAWRRDRADEVDGMPLPEPVAVDRLGDEATYDPVVATSLRVRSGGLGLQIDVTLPQGGDGVLNTEALERHREAAEGARAAGAGAPRGGVGAQATGRRSTTGLSTSAVVHPPTVYTWSPSTNTDSACLVTIGRGPNRHVSVCPS